MSALSAKMRQVGASCAFGVIAAIAIGIAGTILQLNANCNDTAQHRISVANIPLQFAWDVDTAKEIVDKWKGPCKTQAVNQVYIDYPFILAYASLLFFFGLSSERAAARRDMPTLAFIARLSAWGGLLAGLFDCCENVGLLIMIQRGPATPIPFLTSLCASAKCALLANSAAVSLVALEVVIVHWWRRPETPSAPDAGQRK